LHIVRPLGFCRNPEYVVEVELPIEEDVRQALQSRPQNPHGEQGPASLAGVKAGGGHMCNE